MDEELDGIVQGMIANNESDANIQGVISAYNSEKKKSTPTSTPQKSVSGTPTGSSGGVNPAFKNTVPSPIPDFNSMPKSKEKPKYPESENGVEPTFLDNVVSTVKSKVNKLATGSAQLGADYASTPELLYDAFAMPQNAIADYFDIPSLRADSEKFKKNIGVRNAVKEHYQGEVIKLREHAKKVDTQYQDGIYDSFKNGDIIGGFDQLTNSFSESLAATSSIMMGGAFAKAPQLLATSSMVFGAGKNEQLKDENPDMKTNARVVNALATGLAEGAFETIGSGSIGAAARGIIEREGAKKGAIILKDGLTNIYKATIAKNPLLASMGVEGGTEWATKVTQNSIDVATGVKPQDFNVFDGATDALIGGIFGGAVFGAGLKGLENVANSKDKSTIKSNVDKTFELQKALENPDISESTKVELEKGIEKLVKTNQDLVKKNVEHADNLHPKVKEKLVESVTKSDEIKEAVKAITLDNGTNDAQKQILLDGLKEDFKKHNQLKGEILDGKTTPVDVLPLKEQDRLKRQALKELTAEQNPDGKKSIEIDNAQIVERANKIYKTNEELETPTPEAQPQAEVPQQAEAEKVAEISPEVAEIEKRRKEDIDRYDESDIRGIEKINPDAESTKDSPFKVGSKWNDGNRAIIENSLNDENYNGENEPYTAITKIIEPAQFEDGKMTKAAVVEVTHFNTKEEADAFIKNRLEKVKNSAGKRQEKANAKYDAEIEALNQATPPVEDVVATSVEKPSDEQQFEDVKNGDVVSFTYGEKSEIPEIFKDKISSEGEINGKKEIKVTIAKSLADYHLQNEKSPQGNSTIDASIRPTATNVGESGITEQESPAKEGVSKPVDGGEGKGDASVGEFLEFEKVVNESKSVDEAFDKIKNIKGVSSETSKSFRDKYNPKGELPIKEAFAKFYNEVKEGSKSKKTTNSSDVSNIKEVSKPNKGDLVDFGEGLEKVMDIVKTRDGKEFIKSTLADGSFDRENLYPLNEWENTVSKQEEFSKRREENKKAQEEKNAQQKLKEEKQQEIQKEFEDIDGFADDKTAIQKGKILQHLNKKVYRGTVKSELRKIANLPHRFIERDGKKRIIYTEESGTELLLSDVYTTKTGLEYFNHLLDNKKQQTTKSEGKQIEPHSEVNTDVETVKKELKLNEVESLIYDEFKDVPKNEEEIYKKLEKVNDNLYGKVEAIESKINDIDIKLEDNSDAIDKIDEDETLSEAKKKKAIAVLEKEFKDLQKQQKDLESEKEDVNDLIKDISDKLYDWEAEENITAVNEIVNKVNNRLETRKSIKEGTNLFPEDANIPEFVAIKKELIKLTDEKTIADFNSRTAEQVKESEPIIADIKSKAKNAERISKEELEKGIADAEKLLKPPTTKEKIAERIKLSDAKVDDVKAYIKGIDNIFGIKIKIDDVEGLNKNGIDFVEVIASIAKQAIAAGIHIDEAINKTIEHFKGKYDFDVNIDDIKERINPKKEAEPKKPKSKESSKDMEDFRDSWNKDPNPSGEINQYDSGNTIEREHGELRNNQDYEVQKDLARVQIGIKAIEHAKRLFGAQYVEKTLSFIEQANLSPEKKAVAYVLLENEMDARAKEFPDNVGVKKLQDLVRAKSQEFLANSARAIGAGRFRVERFRELAKNGFAEEEYTNAILSTKQIKDKEKIQQLSQVTSEDVDNESDLQESDVDFEIAEPTVKRNQKAVKKDISDVLAQMRKDLLKVAKGNVAMSSVPYAAQLQAVTPHIIKLSKLLAELGGMKTKEIIAEIHNNIKEMFPEIDKNDVSDILKEQSKKKQKPKTDAEKKTDSVKEVVKQALIASGFGKEITVTKNQKDAKGNNVLDADGKVIRVKEQKQVLDWKKLAGEAGTIENIRKNVEASLPDAKYTKAQKKTMQDALEAEYVRLSADVIQKGLDELVRRNTPRKPVNTKTAARKLAELHNYGLFEKSKDSYEKIINDILGFGTLDQKAFDEMKQIAKGYAVLMDSGLSETETKDAINALSRRQSRLVATLAFSRGDWKFKLANAISEMTNLSTRFKLVNLGNLVENVNSGIMARAANTMMDAIATGVTGNKTTNKALRKQSSSNAKAKLIGISTEASESYGDTSSLLLNHSAVEDYFNNATTNKIYHGIISTYMAKPVLEGADSFNKLLITEAKFVRATIKVLQAKGMNNADALDYVTKALTGESMKEALVKAESLITKVNKEAGKKILNTSESSVKSLASDIVKESLVSGGQLTEVELKKIFNAAYKSAGKDIGHVSNNWVTTQISKVSSDVENRLANAIKEQNWNLASREVVNQIIWKNFISTFVGGGTNWFVKGLQKAANPLSLISLREDSMMLSKSGKLDLTTDEGIKNMEEALYRGMNLRSTSATMLMGAIIASTIIGSMMATGADDEIEKWLKENKWAKKYFDKIVPDAVVLMLAINNKDYGRYIAKMVNVKADFFDDQKNIAKIGENLSKGYSKGDAVKTSEAWGDLGSMIGKRFEAPIPLKAGKDVKQIYNGLVNGEYVETNYHTSGFMNGFTQGGILELYGLRPDPNFQEKTKKGAFDFSVPPPPKMNLNPN